MGQMYEDEGEEQGRRGMNTAFVTFQIITVNSVYSEGAVCLRTTRIEESWWFIGHAEVYGNRFRCMSMSCTLARHWR